MSQYPDEVFCNWCHKSCGLVGDVCTCTPLEVSPATPAAQPPPVMLTADQWLEVNAKRVAQTAEAKAARRRMEETNVDQAVEVVVARFMKRIEGGLNPWGDEESIRLKHSHSRAVAIRVAKRLTELGFDVSCHFKNLIAACTSDAPDTQRSVISVFKPKKA